MSSHWPPQHFPNTSDIATNQQEPALCHSAPTPQGDAPAQIFLPSLMAQEGSSSETMDSEHSKILMNKHTSSVMVRNKMLGTGGKVPKPNSRAGKLEVSGCGIQVLVFLTISPRDSKAQTGLRTTGLAQYGALRAMAVWVVQYCSKVDDLPGRAYRGRITKSAWNLVWQF